MKGNEHVETKEREIATLVSLLDDSDDAVLPVVTERIKNLKPNIATLLALSNVYGNNGVMTRRLGRIISEIRTNDVFRELEAWRCERDPELLKGLWLVYRMINPEVTYQEVEEVCMDMAKEVWIEITDNKTAVEKVHLYNHIFYHRIGYKIEDPFMCELPPARLDKALSQKRANPVLFGLLYLDIAFKCGLPIKAVVFPGGFMPVCVDESERILFYINIFNNGEIFQIEQLIHSLKDFGISICKERFVFGKTVTLAGIYAESLYFIVESVGNKEMEQKMEQLLTLFGDEPVLFVEEDDDE